MSAVTVILGSKSDLPVVKKCLDMLKQFSIDAQARVCSAHRTPEMLRQIISDAEASGTEVFIAAAGKAAHLPGVIAAFTTRPVIGLPIKSSLMDGLDSLLSMVQMPSGVPVATVAVDGAANAAILAAQMLSIGNAELRAALCEYKKTLAEQVIAADAAMQLELD